MKTPETEIAWAAGFFDGEGHCSLRLSTHRNGVTRTKYTRLKPILTIGQKDPRPLERFIQAVGVDERKVYHYPKIQYQKLNVGSWDEVVRILNLLWPYLSGPKRDQAEPILKQARKRNGIKSSSQTPVGQNSQS